MKHRKNGFFKSSLFYIVIFLLVMGGIYVISGGGGNHSTQAIPASKFEKYIKSNQIKNYSAQPDGRVYRVSGEYRKAKAGHQKSSAIMPTSKTTRHFSTNVLSPDMSAIDHKAQSNNVSTDAFPQRNSGIWLYLILIFAGGVLLMYFLTSFMKHAGQGGIQMLNKFDKHTIKPTTSKVKFSDVAGEDAEKQELVEIVDFLKDPKKYTRLGAKIPHGVLLEGPPGTGKTLLAKAVAGEANVPFYSVAGSEFVQTFVGVGASRVRNLFKQAKKNAPAIIFIDEIDAIGRKRGGEAGSGNGEREQTLNQLLVELDGFNSQQNVIVMAATNRADVLDPALTRPGRFDRKVLVGRPDVRGRYNILKVHQRNKPLAKDVDLKELARQTPGFAGADLANLLNEAALLAARFNHKTITPKDLDEAEDRVIAGPAKKNAVISPKEERVVADHEAGHTIVGLVLTNARVVHKVTIVPRGRAGGYTMMLPKEDQNLMSKKGAMQQLAGLLGGRTAEEIIYHSKTSGASNDFKQATKLATAMVTVYGMSDKLGDVMLRDPAAGPYARPTYSEHTAMVIDSEIKHFIDIAHRVAYNVIQSHRKQHKIIADALLKYETLDAKEIKSLYETGHMPAHDSKITAMD